MFKQDVFHILLSSTRSACLFHVAGLIVVTALGTEKVCLRMCKDNFFWNVLGSIPLHGFMMNQYALAEGYKQVYSSY